MNKTDSDKLAAIHRSAEINKLEIENMIDIFEKKMSIVENKLIEYECRYELTERQEDMMLNYRSNLMRCKILLIVLKKYAMHWKI